MGQLATNEIRQGTKVEIDGNPYNVVKNEYVKPGKGQAFNRIRLKHLLNGKVVEKTFKSHEKLEVADINETHLRMLYKEGSDVIFMSDDTYEQITISNEVIGDTINWLMEDIVYDVLFYKGEVVAIEPPTFMQLKITDTAPGVRGDTASGRVMKPATLESGAQIQVPIFINEGETIKVDTRTGEYDSRV